MSKQFRTCALRLFWGWFLLFCGQRAAIADSDVGEYQAKTALIYNFAKLVRWPDNAFADGDSPFVFAFLSPDTLGAAPQMIRGKRIHGRSLEVRYYRDVQSVEQGHVLFCSPDSLRKLREVVPDLPALDHVLTVGQTGDFAQRGGILDLTFDEDHLAFIVNLAAARNTDLDISANLLKLASKVIED